MYTHILPSPFPFFLLPPTTVITGHSPRAAVNINTYRAKPQNPHLTHAHKHTGTHTQGE
ncbi:hypothetical protein HBH72_017760 [Parastagonospora nodorum]|nr:hypothetical protein HBH72_017760 [Parastagonospora nodorum]